MRVYILYDKRDTVMGPRKAVAIFPSLRGAKESPLLRHYPQFYEVRPAELQIHEWFDEAVARRVANG